MVPSTFASMVPSPTGRPLSIVDFRWLWSGGLVSLVGTHMQFVALPYFVYQRTGSAFATALTATAQALPALALGPVAGAVADTRDTRRVLVTANVVLAAVTLGFCLVVVGPWWVVLGVALLQATVGQLVAPAEAVLIPGLVPAARLPAANSLLGANYSIARLVGPAVGGVVYAAVGLPAVAVLNALSFAAAAVMVARITRTRAPGGGDALPTTAGLLLAPVRWTAAWAHGWAEIRRQSLLVRLLLVFVVTGVGEGCVSALLAPYVQEVFGGSTALGLLLSCQAASGLAGAVLISRRVRADRLTQTLRRAALACGVLLAVMIGYPLFYDQLWPALLLIAVAGLPFAAVAATQATLLQSLPEPTARGRVFGFVTAAAGAAQLAGILLSGYLADRTTVYLLLADAACYLLAALVMLPTRQSWTPTRLGKQALD